MLNPKREAARIEMNHKSEAVLPYFGRSSANAIVAPMSFEQERMWMLDRLSPGNVANHINGAVDITGPLDAALLEQSVNALIKRHDMLRTHFAVVEGQPQQVISLPETMVLPVSDLQHIPVTQRASEAQHLAIEFVQQPFDLTRAPLWRAHVWQLTNTRHFLVLCMHHAICDGDWSLGIFFQEVAVLYEALRTGAPSPLPTLPMQYRDFAPQQREQLTDDVLATELAYWQQQLGDHPYGLQLPTDHPRPALQTYSGASQSLTLSPTLSASLKALSEAADVPLFVTLLAAFKTYLYRYTNQADIAVGVPTSGRHRTELDGLMGYFGNPVVLRTQMAHDLTFRALLSRLNVVVNQAEAHQHYPFQKLVEALHLSRDLSLSPLFQVLFVMRNAAPRSWTQALMSPVNIGQLSLAPFDIDSQAVPYDLYVSIQETAQGLVWSWAYNTDLFDHATISRMLGHCQNLLHALAANPGQRIGTLALLTDAERHQLLVEWNDTRTAYPAIPVHQLFEAQAERTPEDLAVLYPQTLDGVHDEQRLTYRELNGRANQLAHYLQRLGVGPDARVGLCIERSPEMMVGMLGILKAGGAYVPLDATYPVERLAYMLSHSQARVLVTTQVLQHTVPELAEAAKACEVVDLDGAWPLIARERAENPERQVDANNLAYVIYTSGSTGEPKGAAMAHSALCNLIHWHLNNRLADRGTRMLQFSPISFDVSFHEIFSTWCSGGTLVLVSEHVRRSPFALLDFMIEHRIEKLYLPFIALQQLAEAVESGPIPTSLREVITAGEQLQITPAIANLCRQTACTLHNHYGGTEIQDVTALTLAGDPQRWPVLPAIGRPIDNLQIYVLDAAGQPLPIGVPGELYVGGAGLARGYFNRPELTEERFVANPFGTGLLYKTNDLARYLPDGSLEHLGRIDHLVKIRGFRVELGEIEAVLAHLPAVRECAVVPREDIPGHQELVAYVVPVADQMQRQWTSALQHHLKACLPDYMVPAEIVILDQMPLTPSGKVNRRGLPAPDRSRPELDTTLVVPQSDTEKQIAQIWRDLLQLDVVGTEDNFFDLGGNSLLIMQAHKRLADRFDAKLSPVALFQYPTIQALAQHLGTPSHELTAPSPSSTTTTIPKHSYDRRRTRLQRHRDRSESDIAIIGISCRFPGAPNVEAFWQNLRDGVESISFFTDLEIELDDPALLSRPNYVKAGSVLTDIDQFDASFFGYSAREAEVTDPQQRLLLECAWECFEHAGYNAVTYEGRVGVYTGSGISTYLINNVAPHLGFSPNRPFMEAEAFQAKLSNDRNYYPTRISYKLNLTGPSVNIQTACSTSLVAVHMACQALLHGDCDTALAGGAAIVVPHKVGYSYHDGLIHSPDGHCRAFDAQAQGTLFGNGVGLVALKLLSDARSHGDHIIAVIKGSAVNNDGGLKVGYAAPSVEGQAEVIAEAFAAAAVDAHSVTYIETHGTATAMGDPIEIAALTQAFRDSTSDVRLPQGQCAIGSVKTNLGHLDEAAGIAGLIKTALALQHQQLPPSLHFRQANPQIDFDHSPFYVNTALAEWKTGALDTPRRAGVSSFGMGGTNCHVILEEAPAPAAISNPTERDHHLLTLSAKSPVALQQLAQRYLDHLDAHPQLDLADVCFTANTGRQPFNHRLALVAASTDQLRLHLQATDAVREVHPGPKPIAFLFTGQGAQYPGMGQDLYQSEPVFRDAIEHCEELLQGHLDVALRDVLYPPPGADPDLIHQTAYTQPALFAVEYALAQLWRSWGIEPEVVMGHSVGEYVAACVTGVFSVQAGLSLVAQRGRLMQALPAGGEMVSVMASEGEVLEVLAPYVAWVSMAAINGPRSVVVSGVGEVLGEVCAALEGRGIKTTKLTVSHAFHSPLMAPMLDPFAQVASEVQYAVPQRQLISNVTGELATDEMATASYWVRHVHQPVRFAAGMATLVEQGYEIFVEIGPKPTLLGMGRRCVQGDLGVWLPSLREGKPDWQQILNSLGEFYLQGVPIDWTGFDQGRARRRLPLPTYPFQRQRYWVQANPEDRGSPLVTQGQTSHPLLGDKLDLPGVQDIRFQTKIGASSLHTPLTGAICLEMALAAGIVVTESNEPVHDAQLGLCLEDVHMQPISLDVRAGEATTVQVVLTPAAEHGTTAYTFRIFSLTPQAERPDTQSSWTCQAEGQFQLMTQAKTAVNPVDLAALQAIHLEAVDPNRLDRQQARDTGSQHSGAVVIEQAWRQATEASVLGKMKLPEAFICIATVGDAPYRIHPALWDACWRLLDATSPDDLNRQPDVPVGLTCLRVFARPEATTVWCHLQAHDRGQRPEQSRSVDVQLLAPNGQVMVSIEGLRLELARPQTGMTQEAAEHLLYEVEWRPQARYGQLPDHLPSPQTIQTRLTERWAELKTSPALAAYGDAVTQLETLSVAYILAAFRSMGWQLRLGERFSTVQKASEFGVVEQHRQVLGRFLAILAEAGFLRVFSEQWEVIAIPERQDPLELIRLISCPDAEVEVTLLTRCGPQLPQVLRGTRDPVPLLFPGGDLTTLAKLYRDSPVLQSTNTLVQQAVLSILEPLPTGCGCRILEIGAGTGGTTSHLLPLLPAHQIEYVFTDVSPFFIAKAQETYQAFPFIRYHVLDIEQDPRTQGFEPHHYDLIVAADVLHATQDMHQTMTHVRQLLAANGMLVLMEDVSPLNWVDLTFGLTEGWWKFTDHERRPSHPLMPPAKWETLLQETGFEQVAITVTGEPESPSQSVRRPREAVIVARVDEAQGLETPTSSVGRQTRHWLILADTDEDIGVQLAALLHARDAHCTIAFVGPEFSHHTERSTIQGDVFNINPARSEDFQQLFKSISGVDGIIHCWSLESWEQNLDTATLNSCGSTLHLVQALLKAYTTRELPRLWLVTRGAQAVGGQQVTQVEQSPIWGVGKVIALEHPELQCVCLDLSPSVTGDDAQTLFSEIISSEQIDRVEDQVAFRQQHRYVARLKHRQQSQDVDPTRLSPSASQSLHCEPFEGAYLITGGLGGLGLRVARFLVERGAGHLVLLGRRGATPESRHPINALEQAGATVTVIQADVADREQLARALTEIEQSTPPLRGIIHAAGMLDDGVLQQQTWTRFENVMAPKVQGAWNLHVLTQHQPLDFFVLFSSSSSLLGMAGQANHVAANAFLDALASYRQRQGLTALSINWGSWSEVGTTARLQLEEQLLKRGEGSLAPDQGLHLLEQLLVERPVQVGVMLINWPQFFRQRVRPSPFFADFIETTESLSITEQERTLRQQLETATVEKRRALLSAHVTSQVIQVLGWNASRPLDPALGFFSLGMDSLTSIELRNRLNSSLDCTLPATLVFDHPTLDELLAYLSRTLFADLTEIAQNKDVEAVDTGLSDVQQLSEVEAEALLLQELEGLNP